MKFTILTQYFPPEIGAPQARLSYLAEKTAERGHSVTVLTAMPSYPSGRIFKGYGGFWKREERGKLKVLRSFIVPSQSAAMLPRLAQYLSFAMSSALIGCLALDPPDYLMVESPPLFLGMAGMLLARLKRTRMIFNVSDLWPESVVRLGMLTTDSLAWRISTRLELFCYKQSWLVTGQSKEILRSIVDRSPGTNTYHLTNCVDTDSFHPSRYAPHAREKLSNNEEVTVLYAGLHGLAQGLNQILKAAEYLLSQTENIKFVLIGDGPEKAFLQSVAKHSGLTNVTFLDPVPAAEIPQILASADILLVVLKTSIPGAVPSKLYEAMASARPVVLAASGEAAAIVQNYDAGIVVEPGDGRAIADAILRLSMDSSLREQFGQNGRQAAERSFNKKRIISDFIEYLESVPGN